MVTHLIIWFYISLFFEICHLFWDIVQDNFYEGYLFYASAIILAFLLNYVYFNWKESFNVNFDVLYKFFVFCCRAVSIFFILLFSEMKKYYYYLKNFRYREQITTFTLLFIFKLSSVFIIWRPLFRKWSYFGFYKTNRSKWWKNK